MKKCYSCGAEIEDEDVFCSACGARYAEPAPAEEGKYFCMECGAELSSGAMFCPKCGTKRGEVAVEVKSQAAAEPASQPEPYRPETPVKPVGRTMNLGAKAAFADGAMAEGTVQGMTGQEGVQYKSAPVSYEAPKPFSGYGATAPEAEGMQKDLYIIEFFKNMTKAHNVPVLIYLLLNALFICLLFGNPLVGIVVYLISLCVALSPVGETILRWQTGCKKIVRPELIARIEPLFNEAKRRAIAEAQKEGLAIPDNIRLFVNEEKSPNAFATGRKTICFTEGLLTLPDDQVVATLTHEFGHITHHDTDMILLVTVGNLIVSAIITIIKVTVTVFNVIMGIVCLFMGGTEGAMGHLMTALGSMLTMVCINGLMWLWTQFGNLLVMKSMRSQEYKADEFAFNCGYGNSLCALLNFFEGMTDSSMKPQGLFATLYSTHPENNDRIARLQNLGCTFRDTAKYSSKY